MGREVVQVEGGAGTGGAPLQVTGSNDSIRTVNNFEVDVSFLDALYAGGKISCNTRDRILAGADPAGFGLSEYDLYYLTVGRLGSKSACAPACACAIIAAFVLTTSYKKGDLVSYTPPGAENAGLYQAASDNVPVGTVPTVTTYWTQITSPGPLYLYNSDITNPVLTAIAAPGGAEAATIVASAAYAGSALAALTVPSGRRYRAYVSEPRPSTPGQSMTATEVVKVNLRCVETLNTDGTVSLVITPFWNVEAVAPAAATTVVAVNALTARLRVELV